MKYRKTIFFGDGPRGPNPVPFREYEIDDGIDEVRMDTEKPDPKKYETFGEVLWTPVQMEHLERHAKRLGVTVVELVMYITLKYIDENATL